MATIHVARAGANLGSFSLEEIQEGLRTGRFLPTDLAWQTGMTDWRPLSEVVAAAPATAAAAPGPSPGPTTPPPQFAPPVASAVTATSEPGSGLPWEHRQQLGLVKAFVDTVVLVLTKPAEAFALMKREGDLIEPAIYAAIGGSLGIIVSTLIRLPFHAMGGFMGNRDSAFSGMFGSGIGLIFGLILSPIIVTIGMFIGSGLIHLSLMLLGGAKKPYETTFRVCCFSFGSANVIAIVPFCGGLVASVYNIVLNCMGIARTHEIDTGKAVMAVLLPLVVCCVAAGLMGLVIGGSLMSIFSHAR
jgi:hypothetical protein